MIVYPSKGYQSWISEDEADSYFETRLNSLEWNKADREAALITAFNDLTLLLTLSIDLTLDESPLPLLKVAQAEQALYLIKNDLDSRSVESMSMGSGINVKLGDREPQICHKAVEILVEYLVFRTIPRYR